MDVTPLPGADHYMALLNHDISNFNQTTRGYLEMMLADQFGELTPQQSRAIRICLRQCRRIQTLIESMRLLQNFLGTPSEAAPVSLDEFIEDAMSTIQNEFKDQDIRLRFIPAGRTVTAEKELRTVFEHLFRNGVQYNDCEVVEFDVTVTAAGPDGDGYAVRIADNGNGIPEGKRNDLFGRLEQRRIHGTGVGLPLCKLLLTRWNGTIALDPRPPGEGAAVVVTLPAVK